MEAEKGVDACYLISKIRAKISNLTESFLRSEKHREELLPELLPGIPDDITLIHISTKLPWSAVCVLSLVSRSWKQSIRTRQVRNARVHSNSTETFVVVCKESLSRTNQVLIKLFSVRDESFYPLPPLPSLSRSIGGSICVALDGRIYVIGGVEWRDKASAKVFALDVAGQRQWKQCASMLEPRDFFGCGVFDGKIYVFGGYSSGAYRSFDKRAFGSEVYDPKTNVWSKITPMRTLRSFHQVAVVGKELLVYNGRVEDRELSELNRDGVVNGVRPQPPQQADKFLEFYDPVTNNWRVSTPLRRSELRREWTGKTFTANGNFFSMDSNGSSIRVYNFDTDSWTHLQANVFPVYGKHSNFSPIDIQALNGELVSIGTWRDGPGHPISRSLLKSTGFGKYGAIKWEVEPESHCKTYGEPVISLIEL